MRKSIALIKLVVALCLLVAVFQVQVPVAQSSECTDGQINIVTTGPSCSCDGTRTPKDRFTCVGGEWVYQNSLCGPPFCQGGGDGGGGGGCPYQPGMICPSYCAYCY
jgi:hypothetical protein